MSSLQFSLLGEISVTVNNETAVHFPQKSVPALLAYLAEQGTNQRHERGILAELLWPGMAPQYGRKNLRQTLYELNRVLPETVGGPVILATRQALQRNPEAVIVIDTEQFEEALQKPSRKNLKRAVDLYRGDFLADFYLPDSTAFENWAQSRRAYYRRRYREALQNLIDLDADNAENYARCLLESDPLDEDAARRLMRVLAEGGERAEALKLFDQLEMRLQSELAIEPVAETESLAAAIRAGEPLRAALPGGGVPELLEETADEELRHNLPPQMTPFFGREVELAALATFIADPALRLVTITGAGGMGKTRLALAAAEPYLAAGSPFPDGVYFVDLAPLSETEQIVLALAEALNLSLLGGDNRLPRQQLLEFLRNKEMLLLLDNFEHLLSGVALVMHILQAAPGVRLLVTSRERLNLRQEQVYQIEGLVFPDEDDHMEASAAVQLFVQAARRVQPDFTLQDGNDLACLARINRAVAGMPLALELAASWVAILPLADIAAELERDLDFLETEMRDIPDRHHSVRAVMDTSWKQLNEKEREIFTALSVFRGGFTREAARAVAGASLRQLAALANKSLIQGGGRDGRYQIHPLLRAYGAEKLAEDGEKETAVREAHIRFFCTLLQEAEADIKSKRQQSAVARIEADYQNILAAWYEALTQGQLTLLLEAVYGLGEFYDAAGRWGEGVATMEKIAAKMQAVYGEAPTTAPAARLLVRLWAWCVKLRETYFMACGVQAIRDLVQHFLQLAWDLLAQPVLAGLDTRAEEALLHMLSSRVFFWTGQVEKGLEHHVLSLDLYRALNDRYHTAEVLLTQRYYPPTDESEPEAALGQLKKSLALFRQFGDPRKIVSTLCFLVHLTRNLTDFAAAAYYLDEAFAFAQAANYHLGMIDTHLQATDLAWYRGQFDLALMHDREALSWAEKVNSPIMVGSCLGTMATTQIYRGRFSEATSLFQKVAELNRDHWTMTMSPMAQLHAGDYKAAESLLVENGRYISSLLWLRLTQANYHEALSLAKQKYEGYALDNVPNHERRAWVQAPMAFAFYKLDRLAEARQTLVQCLQTCLAIRAFLPLMQVMPVIPVVLASGTDDHLQERAIELYAMAESLPFVGNSRLYADLVGEHMAAVIAALPQEITSAARQRGKELDWWETAAALLAELTKPGWNLVSGEQDSQAAVFRHRHGRAHH